MYDINKLKKIIKCPYADVVCPREFEGWSGFGCWCCMVVTQGYISDNQIPWKDEYKDDPRYES